MKPSEYPEEDTRAAPLQATGSGSGIVRPPAEKPRFLDLPASLERSRGPRNLTLGIICSALAVIAYWLARYYAPQTATITLLTSLGSFGILWLLQNVRVLRQRHGAVLGFGLVALLGAVIPFVGGAFRHFDHLASKRFGEEPAVETSPLPVPTLATAPLAPTEPLLEKTVPPLPVEDDIVREFVAPPLAETAGKLIRIKEDCIVKIDGRKWRFKTGQTYPFKNLDDGQVTFMAGDQEVTIAMDFVAFHGASQEPPATITKMAEAEAMSRYPALREKGSPENELFLMRVTELKNDPEMSVLFFKNNKWPLVLAEKLAEDNGWKRADIPEPETEPETAPAPAPAPVNSRPILPDQLSDPAPKEQ